MLLAVLLVARAAAEWVEISQHHHRKPVRITTALDAPRNTYQDMQHPTKHDAQTYADLDIKDPTESLHDVSQKPMREYHGSLQNPTKSHFDQDLRLNPFIQDSPIRKIYVDQDVLKSSDRNINLDKRHEIETKNVYINHTIDHSWSQNLHRLGIGQGDDIVSIRKTGFENWNNNSYRINNERNDKPNVMKKQDVNNNDETVSGKIERVPNIGSVKRVQLSNTPVKSPAVGKIPGRRNGDHTYAPNDNNYSDEFEIKSDVFKSNEHAVFKKPSNNFKQEFSSKEDVQIPHMNYDDKVLSEEINFSKSSSQKPSFLLNNDKETNDIQVKNRFQQNEVPETTETIEVINKTKANPHEKISSSEDVSDFVTKDVKNKEFKEQNTPHIKSDDVKNKHRESLYFDSEEKEFNNEGKASSSENSENTNSSSSEIKVNTMENILKFMKVVADTISKNTRRGANGKITYLNELKNTLLNNIRDRIDASWPDDTSAGSRRRSRSASPRGHVEFPSSESSLMTISFLTFAVFLIKLVLVIQTYKHKAMVMAPLMVATAGRAVTKKIQGN